MSGAAGSAASMTALSHLICSDHLSGRDEAVPGWIVRLEITAVLTTGVAVAVSRISSARCKEPLRRDVPAARAGGSGTRI